MRARANLYKNYWRFIRDLPRTFPRKYLHLDPYPQILVGHHKAFAAMLLNIVLPVFIAILKQNVSLKTTYEPTAKSKSLELCT